MKRISMVTLVTSLSLLGLIWIGTNDVEPPAAAAAERDAGLVNESSNDSADPKRTDRDLGADKRAGVRVEPAPKRSQRQFKIDEAVIDIRYIFKNLPEFKRKLEQLKKEIEATDKEAQKKWRRFGKLNARRSEALCRRRN